MYCCFTALLRVALADVAIFNWYYNTPGDDKGRSGQIRTTATWKHVLRNGEGLEGKTGAAPCD